jgi:hypothetical protein
MGFDYFENHGHYFGSDTQAHAHGLARFFYAPNKEKKTVLRMLRSGTLKYLSASSIHDVMQQRQLIAQSAPSRHRHLIRP